MVTARFFPRCYPSVVLCGLVCSVLDAGEDLLPFRSLSFADKLVQARMAHSHQLSFSETRFLQVDARVKYSRDGDANASHDGE